MKLILDTDIGTDVDDLFALAYILGSPGVELLGVTVVHGDVRLRARVARVLLQAAARPDIPVALGAPQPMQYGLEAHWTGHEGHGLALPEWEETMADPRGAQGLMLDMLSRHRGQVNLVAVGPMTNVGLMARDHPDALRGLASLTMMGGNYQGVNARSVLPEHNFRGDPEGALRALGCGCPLKRVVGLNCTRRTALTAEFLNELDAVGTPSGRLLAACGRSYLSQTGRVQTPMHDALAAAVQMDPSLCVWQRLSPVVQTEGREAGVLTYRKPSEGRCSADFAADVRLNAFQPLFRERILGFATSRA